MHQQAESAIYDQLDKYSLKNNFDGPCYSLWYPTHQSCAPVDPSNPVRKKHVVRCTTLGLETWSGPSWRYIEPLAGDIKFEEASVDGCLALCRDHFAFLPELRVTVSFKFFDRHHRGDEGDEGDDALACLAVVMQRRHKDGARSTASKRNDSNRIDIDGDDGDGICVDDGGDDDTDEIYIFDAVNFGSEPLDQSVTDSFPDEIRALPLATHVDVAARSRWVSGHSSESASF